jgi:hypothetical protein
MNEHHLVAACVAIPHALIALGGMESRQIDTEWDLN